MNHLLPDTLLERVRQRCLQEAFQPASFNVITQSHLHGTRSVDTENGLLWPPATISQLELTEALLGFSLPPQLYHSIGNGGFGPAYGITGVKGGAPHPGDWYEDIVAGYQEKWYENESAENDALLAVGDYSIARRRYISLDTIPASQEHGQYFELPMSQWPEYLLPLCYWGCTTEHAIHAQTGAIYTVVDGCAFALWNSSLAEWLEQWLDGSLQQE